MPSRVISILLRDGSPGGLKIIELSNRTIKTFFVPRTRLNDAANIADLKQPTLYLLCDKEGRQVYIGECENFVHRIKSHDQNKDFWEVAIAFTAHGLEKGDVKYLESLAVQEAKEAERMKVVNATVPARNKLHEFKTQTISEFFEDLKLLTSTLGYPVFDRVAIETAQADQIWYCKTRNTKATAIDDGNSFTVLKGSLIDGVDRPSFPRLYPTSSAERHKLFKEKAKLVDAKRHVFELTENIPFISANQAGAFCVGGHMNAWTTWKDRAGKTMDEVIRQS